MELPRFEMLMGDPFPRQASSSIRGFNDQRTLNSKAYRLLASPVKAQVNLAESDCAASVRKKQSAWMSIGKVPKLPSQRASFRSKSRTCAILDQHVLRV
jgi:hypothetical protein